MDKMDKYGMDLEKVNIERLKEIFPECVTDGKVDFDALRTILGDDVETSGEKYSFNWVGKSDAMKIALMPSTGTLRPCKDKSKDWDKTENLYIEGDNLEVLKILEKTYHNQIKMIYIDPPYNTGKDFVYHDDFHDNVSNYLENSEQAFRTNPETAGRFHTDWLNMMYPRLRIARELLKDEGVIFISIDDNELHNLMKICDEIFGESNFVGCICRATGTTTGQDANKIGSSLDYCLVYSKTNDFELNGLDMEEKDLKRFKEKDERGLYSTLQLRKTGNADTREERPNMFYPVIAPDGSEVYPFGPTGYLSRWRVGKDSYKKLLDDNMIVWKKQDTDEVVETDGYVKSKWIPYVKYYLEGRTKQVSNLFQDIEGNKKASLVLKELLGGKGIFDNPKPVEFLEILLQIATNTNDLIMDFFSGSATTAHAVMQLNSEDSGHRKYILVQLPEICDENSEAFKAGYSNICEIGEERIRRAGAKIQEAMKGNGLAVSMLASGVKSTKEIKNDEGETVSQLSMTGMFDAPENVEEVNDEMANNLDVGFKVFKLDSTNIKPWDATVKYDETTLYDLQDSVVKEDRSNLDIAYEVMLKYGIFNMPLEEKEVNGKTVYSVGEGYMIISLNDEITTEDVAAIAALNPKAVVFKESGFVNDNAKMNADYTFKRLGIDNVKCI